MKNSKAFGLVLVIISIICYGCGTNNEPYQDVDEGAVMETATQESETKESETKESETILSISPETITESSGTEVPISESQETVMEESQLEETNLPETPQSTEIQSRVLTDEEITYFTEYIQRREISPFLLSSYTVPEEIDIMLLFYNGIGDGSAAPLTEEERTKYLETTEDGFVADIFPIRREAADVYLQKHLGISLDQVYNQLDLIYFPEYDTYYNMAGDTHLEIYTCNSGWIKDDVINLECTLGYEDSTSSSKTLVTLKENDGEYLILSNQRSN